MHIKRIELDNYKRFNHLVIDDIPETAKLVVLIGPNGTGKSALFDALLLKSLSTKFNHSLERDQSHREYYINSTDRDFASQTRALAHSIEVSFHEGDPPGTDWSTIFNIRTAYRVEPDFSLKSVEPVQPAAESYRFTRIIDPDQAVSDNYGRLAWKRQADLDNDAPAETTFGQYRSESLAKLQSGMKKLFSDPTLGLQDFGGIKNGGVFRFAKGDISDFHYKNLSGGEKAAFDLLLDIFVKGEEYKDAIYCIDEPEAHIATGLHGRLLETILDMIPEASQLWIATHSIGFANKAYELMRQENNVAFLDFSSHDFDQPVTIKPRVPDRAFWQMTYRVAFDDLADLIAPSNIVICEGNENAAAQGFDADAYNRIFGASHPDTIFVSRGSATQVERSEVLIAVIHAVSKGTTVSRLIDRDEMTATAREEKIQQGLRVLTRRELENYLYAPEVLKTFCKQANKSECSNNILAKTQELLAGSQPKFFDFKTINQQLLAYIKTTTQIPNLGNDRSQFALEHLVPALRSTPTVFEELKSDVFG